MSDFPMVLEHMDACGVIGEKHVKSSILNATAAVLLCRGADEIIVPTPGEHEHERALLGIEDMPKERQRLIKIVDEKGIALQKVRDYISPMKEQAKKWPEDAYVSFLEEFLYQICIASKYKAGIVASSVQVVREFIPIIDPKLFTGEARYRLAETINLVCCYEPTRPEHGTLRYDIASKGVSDEIWRILELAEFRSIVSESGKLGYFKKPAIGLKRISGLFMELVRRPQVKPFLRLAHTGAELAGLGTTANGVEKIMGDVEQQRDTQVSFSPPFISLGPAVLPIYRIVLAEKYPTAVPPQDSIMLFEHVRDGKIGHSWLNTGEERKLEREARSGLKNAVRLLEQCRKVQSKFYS